MTAAELNIDWQSMLMPERPIEMLIRGTLTYLGLLIILRVILKRQSGNSSIALSDLLVTVLIADAIQNGMAGEYHSVPDGLLLVTTIVAWDFIIDWLAYRNPRFEKLLNPPALPLIINGKMQRRNMRQELISEEELRTALREHEVLDLSKVKVAFLESDGEISVIVNST